MPLNFPSLDLIQAQAEGFGTPGAPSITAGNNPGAIQWGPYAASYGATGAAPNGAAIFPSLEHGLLAQDALNTLKLTQQGLNTPAMLAQSWTPAAAPGNSPAETSNYAQTLAKGLGIGVNDPIPGSVSLADGLQSVGAGVNAITSWENKLLGLIPGYTAGKTATGADATGIASAVSFWQGLSLSQIVVLILGIGLILGGIFFLRPVQSGITSVGRTVSRLTAVTTG